MTRMCANDCMAFVGTAGKPECKLLVAASRLSGMLLKAPLPVQPPPPIQSPPPIKWR